MISSQQLLAVIALVPAASCIVFPGPLPTHPISQRLIDGWSPKPTQGPSPNELQKRQYDSAETCGWVDGLYVSEIGCPMGATCMLYTDVSPGMAGCCSDFDFQNCAYANTCMDYASMMSGSCGSDCMTNSFIKKCTDTLSPYCVSWTYISDDVQDYGCGTEAISTFETIFQDVTDEAYSITTSLSLPYVADGLVTGYESTATAAATKTSRSLKGSSDTAETTDTAAAATATVTTEPLTNTKSSKVSVGLIAGIAGGAFALVLAIAGLIIFLCLRRKQKRAAATNAAALAAATASRPQSQHYGSNQPMQQNNMPPPPLPPQSQEGYSYFGQPNQPYNSESKFAAQTHAYASSPISAPQTPAPAYQTPVFQTPGTNGYAPLPMASPGPPAPGAVEVDATSRPHLAQGGGPIYEMGPGRQ